MTETPIIDLDAETIAVGPADTPLEFDPFFAVLAGRVGVPVARSFTRAQFLALKRAFGERQTVLRLPRNDALGGWRRPAPARVPVAALGARWGAARRRHREVAGLRDIFGTGLNVAIFALLLWGAVATFSAVFTR